jgi:hypothetical protein
MADKHRASAELVAVGATRRWAGDPLSGRGLDELTEQDHELVDLE